MRERSAFRNPRACSDRVNLCLGISSPGCVSEPTIRKDAKFFFASLPFVPPSQAGSRSQALTRLRESVLPFSNMRKSEPKPLVKRLEDLAKRRQESIVAKCHPAIFELAQLWKDSIKAFKALEPSRPHELIAEIEAHLGNRLAEIHRNYSGPAPPNPKTFTAQIIFSEEALTSKSDAQGIAEILHFERHKIPLKVDLQKRQVRDWNATQRVLRTHRDLEQLRCGKGPIQRFKGDIEHSNMFETLWGFGLERLTSEELADFFDTYCPCGSEAHDPDALKKQRARFQKALSESSNTSARRRDE